MGDLVYAVHLDPVVLQLALLNAQLCAYLVCKGLSYAVRSMFRRDPPMKSTRRLSGSGPSSS